MTEVKNDEDVVYDKLEADITIQLVRETVDNQVKLVAKVSYPETVGILTISLRLQLKPLFSSARN
ncbi:MAG: hypothetical protein ACLRUB_01660 [Streptococcus sp.]